MKTPLLIALVLTSSFAIAQHKNSISRSINDDGKTLSIRVNGTVDGKDVDYDRTFDVSNLTKDERTALRERVLDSLNVSMPEPPRAPRAPIAPRAPRAPRYSESISISSDNDGSVVAINGADNVAMAVSGKHPYTKMVKFNSDSGKLYLRYSFKKDGDDFTYERTLDAQNKSKEERQKMIEDVEKAIGVPTK
ncbi:hypothetical protein GCM10028805_11330 [Spirosoma harenae]